jgi:hypothetical protein
LHVSVTQFGSAETLLFCTLKLGGDTSCLL